MIARALLTARLALALGRVDRATYHEDGRRRGGYMNDPCRNERGGERDDPPDEWRHVRFGIYRAEIAGASVLIRPVTRGRVAFAYVVTVEGRHSEDVPFGENRRIALLRAKAIGAEMAEAAWRQE